MKAVLKICVLSLVMAFTAVSVGAEGSIVVRKPAGDEYWYILKQAQDAFDFGEYGRCVSLAEQAKKKRMSQIQWEQYTLDHAQRISSVRNAGDELNVVIQALDKTKQKNALDIVRSYLSTYGDAKFKNSFSNLLSFINRNNSYPEADYLLGSVYMVEGEVKNASLYMKKAYEAADLLSVPEVKYDILYDLGKMAKNQLEASDYAEYLRNSGKSSPYFTDYEKYMLDILADDEFYTDAIFMKSMETVISGNTPKSVDRFFVLYRSNVDRSLAALDGLSKYYKTVSTMLSDPKKVRSEKSKSLRCAALATVIAVTRIEETLGDRLTNFKYQSLADLLKKAGEYSDIVNWGHDNGIWELFYNLADVAGEMGYTSFAAGLFTVLGDTLPDNYWKNKASSRISRSSAGSES
ncbi:MAG: hypothetical protein ILP07_02380 [Treponema sp.]|nr:hypothetical protein [Treponema sp.]